MTNSTKLIGLIMTVALWAGVAVGQGVPTSDWGDDLPPDLTLPSSPQMRASAHDDDRCRRRTSAVPLNRLRACHRRTPYAPTWTATTWVSNANTRDGGGFWNEIAPIESTGTWLQRGFWYCRSRRGHIQSYLESIRPTTRRRRHQCKLPPDQ